MQVLEYFQPASISEALAFLSHEPNNTKILAGGTDLVIQLRERSIRPNYIVDLANVKELKSITSDGKSITIGSMVTFQELEQNPLVFEYLPMLAKAGGTVGSPQIRNIATIGGNIANAATAADSIPALLALEAKINLACKNSTRQVDLEEILVGINKTSIAADELLTSIVIPIPQGKTFASFIKIGRRKALAIARLNIALTLKFAPDNIIEKATLAAGAVGVTAYRIQQVETYLQGKFLTDEVIAEAGKLISLVVADKLGTRPTAPYKKTIAKGALLKALKQIKEEHGGC